MNQQIKRNRTNTTLLECYYNSRLVTYLVLHDKFGYGQKRIKRLEDAVDKYLDDYSTGEYPKGYFEREMKKRGIDAHEVVSKIPSRAKLFLTYGDKLPKRIKPSDLATINAALFTFFAITLYAMNKDMKISCVKLKDEFLKWLQFNFERLAEKDRLKIEDIVLVMVEECGYLDQRYEKQYVGEDNE